MSHRSLIVAACAGLVLAGTLARTLAANARAAETPLEHGRYLVQRVGMCADCHGPGLRGATLAFLAPGLPPAVARKAPRITGLPDLSSAQAVHYFETGLLPTGRQARPPMPAIRLHQDDAEAITAYLKSLH
ncbi:MAG: c-type cytochrome [Candidatus Elarobacter sp.]